MGKRGDGSSGIHPQPSIDEQINLLQSAALCAQMPGSNRRSEPIRQAMVELTQLKHQLQGNAPVGGGDAAAGQQRGPVDAAEPGDVRWRAASSLYEQGGEDSSDSRRRRSTSFAPGSGDAAG